MLSGSAATPSDGRAPRASPGSAVELDAAGCAGPPARPRRRRRAAAGGAGGARVARHDHRRTAVRPGLYRMLAAWPAFLAHVATVLRPHLDEAATGVACQRLLTAIDAEIPAVLAALPALPTTPPMPPAREFGDVLAALDTYRRRVPRWWSSADARRRPAAPARRASRRAVLEERALTAILPSRNVNTSQPLTATWVPSARRAREHSTPTGRGLPPPRDARRWKAPRRDRSNTAEGLAVPARARS